MLQGVNISSLLVTIFYTVLIMQLSVGFWVGTFGFFVKLCAKDAEAALATACPLLKNLPANHKLKKRVAVLLPIYNEEVRRVLLGLEALLELEALLVPEPLPRVRQAQSLERFLLLALQLQVLEWLVWWVLP